MASVVDGRHGVETKWTVIHVSGQNSTSAFHKVA